MLETTKYKLLYEDLREDLHPYKLSIYNERLAKDVYRYTVSDIPRKVNVSVGPYTRMCVYLNLENEICMKISETEPEKYSVELNTKELYRFINILIDPNGHRSSKMHRINDKVSLRYEHLTGLRSREFCFELMRALELMHFRKARLEPLTLRELCRWHINTKKLDTTALPKQLAEFCQNKHVLLGDLSLDKGLPFDDPCPY